MRLGIPFAAMLMAQLTIMASLATAFNLHDMAANADHPGQALQQLMQHLTEEVQAAPKLLRAEEAHAKDLYAQGRRAAINIVYSDTQQTQACTDFKAAFMNLLFENGDPGAGPADYPPGCGYADSFAIPSDPANNLTWFTKMCTYQGENTTTECGAAGFYAKSRVVAMEYSGRLPADCALGEYQAKDILKVLNLLTAVYCSSDGTKYCLPEFVTSLGHVDGADLTSNDTMYPKICTPCTTKVIENVALAFQDEPGIKSIVMAFDLICLNIDDEWCYKEYLTTAPEKAPGSTYCTSQCLRRIFNRYYLAVDLELSSQNQTISNSDGVGSLSLMDIRCMKTASDQYCSDVIDIATFARYGTLVAESSCGAPANGPATKPMPPVPAQCSSQCKADLQAFSDAWGCCYGSFSQSKIAPLPDAWIQYWTDLMSSCGLPNNMTNTCESASWAQPVEFCLTMPNLKYAFYTMYKDKVDTELCYSQLPHILPVSPTTCTVTGAKQIDGLTASTHGTKACFRIIMGSKDQGDWLTNIISSGSPRQYLKAVSSLPGESRNVPTSVVEGSLELGMLTNARFTQFVDCHETRTWSEISRDYIGAQHLFYSGSLGSMATADFGVWACFKGHPCLWKVGASPDDDAMCYMYHEKEEAWHPLALMSEMSFCGAAT